MRNTRSKYSLLLDNQGIRTRIRFERRKKDTGNIDDPDLTSLNELRSTSDRRRMERSKGARENFSGPGKGGEGEGENIRT